MRITARTRMETLVEYGGVRGTREEEMGGDLDDE